MLEERGSWGGEGDGWWRSGKREWGRWGRGEVERRVVKRKGKAEEVEERLVRKGTWRGGGR